MARKRKKILLENITVADAGAKAKAITPVPGGVGPMPIAMLVENTVEAAENTLK